MDFFYLKNGKKNYILYARRIEIGTIAPLTMTFNMKFNKRIKLRKNKMAAEFKMAASQYLGENVVISKLLFLSHHLRKMHKN